MDERAREIGRKMGDWEEIEKRAGDRGKEKEEKEKDREKDRKRGVNGAD